jgi:hypothetical protein
MSFFQKKMSQNDWATILPFGPVTNFYSGQPKASPHFRHWDSLLIISNVEKS